MNNPASNGKTIWITGASTGIGRSLAEYYLDAGNRVIATARSADALEELKTKYPEAAEILVADISTEHCTGDIAQKLSALGNSLDTVILNAGTCEYVDTQNFESEMFGRVFQVNLMGMARCIEAALPLLRKSVKQPHIVGISSAAAITGLPRAEAYGASKAAVSSMLESLALDLQKENIDVSIVLPGFVDTPLTRRNDFPMPFLMQPEQATACIVRGIEKRKLTISFPRRLIWSLRFLSLLPDRLRHRIGVSMSRDNA